MKKTLIRIAKWSAIAFAGLLALGVVIQIVDPEGAKRRAEERNAKRAATASEKPAAEATQSKCFMHGFVLGHTMARDGAKKPTADDVDALARRSRKALEEGGSAFNPYEWKDAFWLGWNKGD